MTVLLVVIALATVGFACCWVGCLVQTLRGLRR